LKKVGKKRGINLSEISKEEGGRIIVVGEREIAYS